MAAAFRGRYVAPSLARPGPRLHRIPPDPETDAVQSSLAQFPCPDAPGLVAFWRAEFIEHEVPPVEPEPGVVMADAGFARVTVRALEGLGEIEVACDDPGLMVDLRTGIDDHMAEFAPDLPPLVWTGAGEAGAQPPNFSAARVAGCTPLGASWLRMTLALEPAALQRFTGAHWHFRLLRPPWPGARRSSRC